MKKHYLLSRRCQRMSQPLTEEYFTYLYFYKSLWGVYVPFTTLTTFTMIICQICLHLLDGGNESDNNEHTEPTFFHPFSVHPGSSTGPQFTFQRHITHPTAIFFSVLFPLPGRLLTPWKNAISLKTC